MWTNGTILQEIATILDLPMSLIMGKTNNSSLLANKEGEITKEALVND